jgi:hypothetical protein
MNLIDFTKNGGYRFKQFTLRKMQEAYFLILKAFVGYLGLPNTGSYLISGCTVIDGITITDGYLWIDGELCFFASSAGNVATKIKKNVVTQTLGFKNGNDEEVFRFVNAVTDEDEGVALNDFLRLYPVYDSQYVHTDNNFSDEEKTKLNGIEDGAEVNVQGDWTEDDNTSDAFIKNKPSGNLLTYLLKGSYNLGNPVANDIRTISFTSVGTASYMVVGSLVSKGANFDFDNDTIWMVREKTATSFKLVISENAPSDQDLDFDYCLIPF